ncbi:MAG: BatD family protein [Verrucomicrobiota bacterium]
MKLETRHEVRLARSDGSVAANLKPLVAVLGIFLCTGAFAADVRMSIEPQLISLLDRAVLKIEFIDTKGDAVDIPNIEGLRIQYQGQSSETRIVNMKRTSKIIHNYVVTPTKVGDFTIGPVTCKYKGGQKEVSAQLRVIKPEDDKEAQQISKIMFSRISTEREKPYVHEPFNLNMKVYIRDGVQTDGNFSLRGGIPETGMEGELQWEITAKEREERNGVIFNVYTLGTSARTLTAGIFTFRPEVQLNVVVPRQKRRPYGFNDPFFGDFFGRQETRPIVLDCNTLEVEVQPVPIERRPDTFTGGVGTFDFDVSIGPEQVKAGEPITVKMKISGKGNINQITPPTIKANHNLKLYEAHTLPSKNPNEVLFEQVVIPTSDSVTNIPAITFSYFNTQTADFRTITNGPFPVSVEAMPQQAAQVIATIPSSIRQETEILGRDIVYLKSIPKKWKKTDDTPWQRNRFFQILLALPLLLLAAIAGITAHQNRLASNVALARRQKAPRAARHSTQLAEQALRKGNETAFNEALWNALTNYFGHRLNLAPGEVTLQKVLDRVPTEAESLEKLFNTIEQHRYGLNSGGSSQEEMKALLQQLNTTLRKCERMKL